MILDSLKNCGVYLTLHPHFGKAFEFIKTNDLKNMDLGKHEIEGDKLFVIVMEYDTKPAPECVMENHKKYIDIQFMVIGEELMGTALYNGQVPSDPYEEKRDAAFYKNEYTSLIRVQQEQFAIFFPHDLHMPCIQTDQVSKVRKAVFKVSVA